MSPAPLPPRGSDIAPFMFTFTIHIPLIPTIPSSYADDTAILAANPDPLTINELKSTISTTISPLQLPITFSTQGKRN